MFIKRLLICLGLVALTTPALCAQYFTVSGSRDEAMYY
jgi:hypothetical protein